MIVAFVIAGMIVATITFAAVWVAPRMLPQTVVFEENPDAPKRFGSEMAWIAIRSTDSAAVADVLGLANGVKTNWNSGIGTVYDEELGSGHLFLSPPVEGWTFLVGLSLPHPLGPAFVDKVTPLLLGLGQHFADVQYFFTYPTMDFFAWARVRQGRLVRRFAVNDEGVVWDNGRLTPEERALGLRLFELRGVRERDGDAGGEIVLYPTEDHVLQIARGWGIDPMQIELLPGEPGNGYVVRVPSAWCAERARKRAA
jgi:hypothetical protein